MNDRARVEREAITALHSGARVIGIGYDGTITLAVSTIRGERIVTVPLPFPAAGIIAPEQTADRGAIVDGQKGRRAAVRPSARKGRRS